MSLEIELLPVGEGSKAGDCILIRYGEPNSYHLMVVDGGTTESGKSLVEHIRNQFPAAKRIEHVVLTHADADHASGLRELFGEFEIGTLWMHVPWTLAREATAFFDGNPTPDQIERKVRKEYDILAELADLSKEHDIEIRMPFAGTNIGPFKVLSPSRDMYLKLLPQFERTPDPDQNALEAIGAWLGKGKSFLAKAFEAFASLVLESYENETLRDGEMTSASNESSVVMYGTDENRRYLLTGDAGLVALNFAANFADSLGMPLQQFTFVQIPHHGSRHNVGPTILNRLLGNPITEGDGKRGSAHVSAPKDDARHPKKVVTNAFIRRGYDVFATQGEKKLFRGGFPTRHGYSNATPMAFSHEVEAYD